MRLLRPVNKHDLELIRLNRNKPEIMRWLRQNEPLTEGQQEHWWKQEQFNGSHFHFMIDNVKGYCALRVDDRHKSAEFSIISFGNTNMGYFGLRELLSFGFGMGLNRIYSDVIAGNPALKLYNLMGFVNEGTSHKAYLKEGEWKDAISIGLLKDEYKKKS